MLGRAVIESQSQLKPIKTCCSDWFARESERPFSDSGQNRLKHIKTILGPKPYSPSPRRICARGACKMDSADLLSGMIQKGSQKLDM